MFFLSFLYSFFYSWILCAAPKIYIYKKRFTHFDKHIYINENEIHRCCNQLILDPNGIQEGVKIKKEARPYHELPRTNI